MMFEIDVPDDTLLCVDDFSLLEEELSYSGSETDKIALTLGLLRLGLPIRSRQRSRSEP